jgi:glycosyltransferase involved in cell wall biosynthesis
MRIFYDHQIFSLQDAGGASRYFYELARHLRGEDDLRLEIDLGLNNSIYPFAEIANGGVHIFGLRSRVNVGAFRYIVNELISNSLGLIRGSFDIYHPTLYRAIPFVRSRKLVVTHHDCIHERFPHLFRNAAMVIRNKERLYAAADAIICVSESSRRDLLRFYPVSEQRTHVIYHGLAPFVKRVSGDISPCSIATKYILFVGARRAYKNFMSLLDAYAASDIAVDYQLVAVGGGAVSASEAKRIEELGVAKRVKIIARATDEVLATMYRNAALFVYPSLYEGFGFPPLEAMSAGCPVLTVNVSSMPEICGDAAFYFDSEDPGSLKEALQRILSNREAIAQIKVKGYHQILRYQWDHTAKQTLELYRHVLTE